MWWSGPPRVAWAFTNNNGGMALVAVSPHGLLEYGLDVGRRSKREVHWILPHVTGYERSRLTLMLRIRSHCIFFLSLIPLTRRPLVRHSTRIVAERFFIFTDWREGSRHRGAILLPNLLCTVCLIFILYHLCRVLFRKSMLAFGQVVYIILSEM